MHRSGQELIPAHSKFEIELAQRWPYGMAALFIGVLLPVVSGFPSASQRVEGQAGEVAVAIVLGVVFAAAMLVIAAAVGRRRRELALALLVVSTIIAHPVLPLIGVERQGLDASLRISLGVVVILYVGALASNLGGVFGALVLRLTVALAGFAALLVVAAELRPEAWILPSAVLAFGAAAIVAGTGAVLAGHRTIDGAVLAPGFLVLSIGYATVLAVVHGPDGLTLGSVLLVSVSVLLAVASSFVALFEAVHRRETEREARRLLRTLEVARLTDVSARYEELAHDQRGALLAIEAAARRLSERPSAELADAIAKEAVRIQRLYDGISRPPQAMDVAATLEPMLRCIASIHDGVVLDAAPSIGAWGDADETVEIVLTLVDNAIQHGNGRVRVSVANDGGEAVVRVSDQGSGVPAALAESIFERGVTSVPSSHTGLGLYSARRLAEQFGGTLIVAGGHGSTFELRLPTERERRDPTPTTEAPSEPWTANG